MANTTFSPATGGNLAYITDRFGGVDHPGLKLGVGAEGVFEWVSVTNPLAVGGAGTTALGKAIDSAAGASDVGVPFLGVRDDALSALTPAEGDWVPARVDGTGHLWVKLGSNDGTVIGDVNSLTQPADDRTTDSQSAALASDAIMNNKTAMTPKFAVIAGAIGDNTIVGIVSGKSIRVTSYFIVATAATTVRFESSAGGTALTGAMSLAANGILQAPFDPTGHFQTASGALLNLELTGAAQGYLKYVEV